MTATLHIEHPVRDFDTWKSVFDGFHDFRVQRGVRSYRVGRGVAPSLCVTIDLVFDDPTAATAFHHALAERVWSGQQATDLLEGPPTAVVLNLVEDITIAT